MRIRLEKFLAERGIGSRRLAKQYVIDGQVKINGKQVFYSRQTH
jgi:16S rRNA U516 pseudouridylate synthase RsuA-like enzyme